jgi:hypothetical protein
MLEATKVIFTDLSGVLEILSATASVMINPLWPHPGRIRIVEWPIQEPTQRQVPAEARAGLILLGLEVALVALTTALLALLGGWARRACP